MENLCKLDISSLKELYNEGNYEQFISEYERLMNTDEYKNLAIGVKNELDSLYKLAKAKLASKKDSGQIVDKTNHELPSLDGETESEEYATQDVGGSKVDVSDLDNMQTGKSYSITMN